MSTKQYCTKTISETKTGQKTRKVSTSRSVISDGSNVTGHLFESLRDGGIAAHCARLLLQSPSFGKISGTTLSPIHSTFITASACRFASCNTIQSVDVVFWLSSGKAAYADSAS